MGPDAKDVARDAMRDAVLEGKKALGMRVAR